MKTNPGAGQGTTIPELSFAVNGDGFDPKHPMVLSCGGIFIPRRRVPQALKTWRQIVNLPGDLSAKIFGFPPPDPREEFESLLSKERLV